MSARALDARTVEVSFAIAEGYYMYRERFKFAVDPGSGAQLGTPQFPAGTRKKDEFFGDVETYRKQVAIRLPVEESDGTLRLTVTSQGCADLGVCYVPMDSKATIRLAAFSAPVPGAPSAPRAEFTTQTSDFEIARLFESGGPLLVLASFLGFGLLLAFTPCVLPMMPILSGIIVGEGRDLGKLRALLLSLAYVLGMAVAYALAGVAAAWSGAMLAAALQNAWVLGSFALVFVAARAVDVRPLRAAAARLPAPSPVVGARHGLPAASSPRWPAWACSRRSSSAPASRRRSPARCSTSARRAMWRWAARRCSRWRSAWAFRCWRSGSRKARCCRNRVPGWCA